MPDEVFQCVVEFLQDNGYDTHINGYVANVYKPRTNNMSGEYLGYIFQYGSSLIIGVVKPQFRDGEWKSEHKFDLHDPNSLQDILVYIRGDRQ